MPVRLKIKHITEYTYDREVILSPHIIRLRPAPHCRMPIYNYSLDVQPAEHFINWQQDPFGNFQARCVFTAKTKKLSISVDIITDIIEINPFDFFIEEYVVSYPFQYDPVLAGDLVNYLKISENGDLLSAWVSGHDVRKEDTINFLVTLNRKLHADIKYLVRLDPGVQTCEQTLQMRSGSCRDSAWLLIQILRRLGIAARYVSGYLVQYAEDAGITGEFSTIDKNCADLHAWVEVYLPGAGWLGLDPSSGVFAGRGYIPLACTPEPAGAAPVTGTHSKGNTEFSYSSSIERISPQDLPF